MRKQLKNLHTGHFIYTILVRPIFTQMTITIAKRKISEISRKGFYKNFEIFTESIEHRNFSNKIVIDNSKENDYIWNTGPFIYCFSEDVLMEELKNELKYIKLKMIEGQKFLITNEYYRLFVPRLMELIYKNKSGYAEISTSEITIQKR